METDHQSILRLLEEQLNAAIRWRDAARDHFDAATQKLPIGISDQDGTQRIINASAEYTAAHKGLTQAMKRISDFQIRSIVPGDLLPN